MRRKKIIIEILYLKKSQRNKYKVFNISIPKSKIVIKTHIFLPTGLLPSGARDIRFLPLTQKSNISDLKGSPISSKKSRNSLRERNLRP
jgi:hypothetical protein